MLSASVLCYQRAYELLLRFCWQVPFAYTVVHVTTLLHAWQLYRISSRLNCMMGTMCFLQALIAIVKRLSTNTGRWIRVCIHVTVQSGTKITVKTALEKLFALQQLLLPYDYWIFNRSIKLYFMVSVVVALLLDTLWSFVLSIQSKTLR